MVLWLIWLWLWLLMAMAMIIDGLMTMVVVDGLMAMVNPVVGKHVVDNLG